MAFVISTSSAPQFEFLPELASAKLVVIKPNLGYPKQHPVVTRAGLIAVLIDHLLVKAPHARVVVLEGICCKEPFPLVINRVGIGGWFDWSAFEATGIAHGATLHWGERVELWDADRCETREYENRGPAFRFKSILAPAILAEADLCLSVAPLKKTILKDEPLISGVIKNFFGLLPRQAYKARSATSRGQLHRPDVHQVICDVYGALAPLFHYGIVDLHEHFISKDWKPDTGKSVPVGKVVFSDSLLEADVQAMNLVEEPLDRFHQILLERQKGESVP